MLENIEFKTFCSGFTALSEKKLEFSDFVSATRNQTPNFIKHENYIQKVYDSISILEKCLILCGIVFLMYCDY